jgi:IS4 transposase
LSAELLALIYRYRWRVELFFKWLKCILGCRHWLAESPRGVALQVYCALIAALLLLRSSGRRPGKRAMELIRFYLLGYATLDELTRQLGIEKQSA